MSWHCPFDGGGTRKNWKLSWIRPPPDNARTRKAEVIIWAILFGGVVVLWIFVGGLPLIRPRRWWQEPGVFITICTLTATLLFPVPGIGILYRIPLLFAAFAWLYWLLLLIWKTLLFLWRQFPLHKAAQTA